MINRPEPNLTGTLSSQKNAWRAAWRPDPAVICPFVVFYIFQSSRYQLLWAGHAALFQTGQNDTWFTMCRRCWVQMNSSFSFFPQIYTKLLSRPQGRQITQFRCLRTHQVPNTQFPSTGWPVMILKPCVSFMCEFKKKRTCVSYQVLCSTTNGQIHGNCCSNCSIRVHIHLLLLKGFT